MRDTVRYALRYGRWARSRTPCSSGATSRRSSTSATARWRTAALLDRERALHAGRLVAVDRAQERVGAGLQVDARSAAPRRRSPSRSPPPRRCPRSRPRAAPGRVAEPDRDLAGLGGRIGLIELQRAVRRRRERQLRPSPPSPESAGVDVASAVAAGVAALCSSSSSPPHPAKTAVASAAAMMMRRMLPPCRWDVAGVSCEYSPARTSVSSGVRAARDADPRRTRRSGRQSTGRRRRGRGRRRGTCPRSRSSPSARSAPRNTASPGGRPFTHRCTSVPARPGCSSARAEAPAAPWSARL